MSADVHHNQDEEEDDVMIVLGAGTHKRSHTIAAVAVGTGEVLGERTVPVGARRFASLLVASLLVWARGWRERVWALEDCGTWPGPLSAS